MCVFGYDTIVYITYYNMCLLCGCCCYCISRYIIITYDDSIVFVCSFIKFLSAMSYSTIALLYWKYQILYTSCAVQILFCVFVMDEVVMNNGISLLNL